MHILFLIISLAGLTLLSANRLKIPCNLAPIFSISLTVLLMYLFTLCSQAHVGAWLLFAVNILAIIDFCLNFLFRKGWLRANLSQICCLALFASFAAILVYYSRVWNYLCWDEFMHWDPFVRIIYKTDAFYSSGGVFIHPHYVQGLPLYAVYLAFLSKYSDGIIILSANIYLLAAFFMFLNKWHDWKNVIVNIVCVIFCFAVSLAYNSLFLNAFLADFLVGTIFSGLLFQIYIDDSFSNVKILLPIISAYILVKDICMFMMVCVLVCYVVLRILSMNKKDSNTTDKLKEISYPSVAIATTMVITYLSWQVRIKIFGITSDMQLLTDPREYFIAFISQTNSYYNSIIDNFLGRVFNEVIFGLFTISQFYCIFTLVSLLLCLLFFMRKNLRIQFLLIALIGIFPIYCVALLGVFLGSPLAGQSELELGASSYSRYFSTYVLSAMLLVFFLVKDSISTNQIRWRWLALLFELGFMFYTFELHTLEPKYRCFIGLEGSDPRWVEAKQVYKKFAGEFPPDSKVQLIIRDNDMLTRLMINDLFVGENVYFDLNEMMDFNPYFMNADEFLPILDERNIDYVFTYTTTPEFWTAYDEIFEGNDADSIYFPAIYQYDRERQLLVLKDVE